MEGRRPDRKEGIKKAKKKGKNEESIIEIHSQRKILLIVKNSERKEERRKEWRKQSNILK